MKKIVTIISILVVLVLGMALSSCSFSKSSKVLPEKREVESIDLLVFNENGESIKKTLSDEEKQSLVEKFNDLGYMDRYIIDLKKTISSEEFDYTLTINIKKKGLKKAYSYYVYIGRYLTYKAIGKEITKEYDEKYLKIDDGKKQFAGQVTDEIAKQLKEIKLSMI